MCSVTASFVSGRCNQNEYLQLKTGHCIPCTDCRKIGLVQWVPCKARSDALCGRKWMPPKGCKKDNYLQLETGLCSSCTKCRDFGRETLRQCSAYSNTICRQQTRVQNSEVTNSGNIFKRPTVEVAMEAVIGVAIGLAVMLPIIVISYILYQRLQRRSSHRIIHENLVSSLQEIADRRNLAVKNTNIYFRTEDIMKGNRQV